jgi:uncharacterized membrane protein YphA (DoxX/SURF4 family)
MSTSLPELNNTNVGCMISQEMQQPRPRPFLLLLLRLFSRIMFHQSGFIKKSGEADRVQTVEY